MSEYSTLPTRHVKRRGKTRACAWCGQPIKVGETYDKCLWYDCGERTTVYVHGECAGAWESGEMGDGDAERPEKGCIVERRLNE